MNELHSLHPAMLRRWPLPEPDHGGDKEDRGRVLLVAGSRELPGAALLAAEAALRAGCGKLTLATAESVAPGLALALPEARVVPLPETEAGGLQLAGLAALRPLCERTHAALLGPGLMERHTCALVRALLPLLRGVPVLLDALAMDVLLPRAPHEALAQPLAQPVMITPHAGEMAHLTPRSKGEVQAEPLQAALGFARQWQITVVLKGPTTHVVVPEGQSWRHTGGNAALACSGSGDVLAGVIAGLLARGATLPQAACWGVVLHAQAGLLLSQRLGPVGVLARELPAEVPALLREFAAP